MQFQYVHFNKTGGTTLQNLFRSSVKEGRYYDCATIDTNQISYDKLFMKRIVHDVSWRSVQGWDPITIAVFRDPVGRLFSDYCMLRRWQSGGDTNLPASLAKQLEINSSFDDFFDSKSRVVFDFRFNHYAARLLGPKFRSWINHRLAFHNGNFDDIDTLMAEAELAVNKLDVCILIEDFQNINPIIDLVAGHEIHTRSHQLRLNEFNSTDLFTELTSNQADILRSCTNIDSAIFEVARNRARKTDYIALRDNWLLEDDSLFFDFEDTISISNVYPRECNPPKYSVWTRAGGACLSFGAKNTRNKRLFGQISGYLKREHISEIAVSVGGEMVQHVIHYIDGQLYLDATIPGELFCGSSRRDIVIWAPAEPVGTSIDDRVLGIELSSLSIVSSAH